MIPKCNFSCSVYLADKTRGQFANSEYGFSVIWMIFIACIAVYHIIMITFVSRHFTQGKTPLHLAALTSSAACCKLLIDHHADIEAKDNLVSVLY